MKGGGLATRLRISFLIQMLDSHSLFCYSMKGYYREEILYSPK